ncbi:MAG TPA: HAMP domain-containing sensor histidine kinase [Ruminiclostridium sp.]
MKYSLRTKLSFSYVLVALFLVAAVSFLTNFLLEKQFQSYVIQQQEQRNKETVDLISQRYKENGKGWEGADIESIGVSALAQGIIVKVKDASDQMIWDATVHNNGMCSTMLDHMAQNMSSRYHGFKGGYVETNYPVTRNLKQVGSIDIGYYGPYYYTDNDLDFINTLNKLLVAVGVLALLFALLLGNFMAKRLSMPISRVITSAKQISKGYFGDRILEASNTKEIEQLTSTFNDLAENLEGQENLRKRLSADVAHELRTPLATLQSHLEAMIDGIWEPDKERLTSCHEEILRINRMVGDLERLARYEGENLILNKTTFDISEIIQHIVNNFETDFANKRIEISFDGKEEKIIADKDKISQVVVNLVSNALKYTLEGGSVEIGVKNLANKTEISVKDTGMGIPPKDLPHIFERFYRADKSRNRMTGGTGIGLAIVKAIVEAHKGSVTVKSDLNKGTEFIVILPKQAS